MPCDGYNLLIENIWVDWADSGTSAHGPVRKTMSGALQRRFMRLAVYLKDRHSIQWFSCEKSIEASERTRNYSLGTDCKSSLASKLSTHRAAMTATQRVDVQPFVEKVLCNRMYWWRAVSDP